MVTLPLDDVSGLQFGAGTVSGSGPAFHRTHFALQRTGDCFLELPGWRKGSAWINGFHLEQYARYHRAYDEGRFPTAAAMDEQM